MSGAFARRAVPALALVAVLAGLAGLALGHQGAAAQGGGSGDALVAEMERGIDGGTVRYTERLLEEAQETGASVLVLQLNTPGGSLDATREMAELLLEAPIPVVVHVTPNGARAASAGTFVGAAAHVLAMAPVSNIGAAAPVDASGEDLPATLDSKAREDAAALIRSIAEARGRNVEALEATVLESAAYSSAEALELGIADLVADGTGDLLGQINGLEVEVRGMAATLNTSGVAVQTAEESFLGRLLGFFASPNVAYTLLVLGILGLIAEVLFLGTWVAGTLGILSLGLGLGLLFQLPFSWLGLGLMGLSLALFIAETQAPGWGIFGAGGVVALVLGGVFLFNGDEFFGAEPQVSLWLLLAVGIVAGLVLAWFVWELRQSRKVPGYRSEVLVSSLVGSEAVVVRELAPEGQVHANGEFWRAVLSGGGSAEKGGTVRVVGVDGQVLMVERLDTGAAAVV